MRCRQVVVLLSLASENAAWIIGDIFQVDGVGWADHELILFGFTAIIQKGFSCFYPSGKHRRHYGSVTF